MKPDEKPSRRRSNALTYVRHLCAAGVPGAQLLPALLPALRELVPAQSAAFFYANAKGDMSNIVAERLLSLEVMAVYYARYHRTDALAFAQGYRERIAKDDPVSAHTLTDTERARPYYRDVLSKIGANHFLYAIVRDAAGAPVGQLSLYRGATEVPFSEHDCEALRALLPQISPAIAVRAEQAPTHVALAIVTAQAHALLGASGKVTGWSQNWEPTLRMFASDRLTPAETVAEAKRMANALRTLRGKLKKGIRVGTHQNANGAFDWALTPLDANDAAASLILVSVTQKRPKALALANGAALLGLSLAQTRVALLLANGTQTTDIALLCGVSVNTANYHVREVFTKCNVTDRRDISRALLSHAGLA
jgi:DNA-binding CsgD family transcriptional regulator